MKRVPSFKRGLYKYYSSYLFKLYKAKARFDLLRWGISDSELEPLAKVYWSEYIRKKLSKEAKFYGCRPLPPGPIVEKKSDRAYILGCSGSINSVSKVEWEEIDKHFSIGLNFFHTHEFTPSLYMTEFDSYQSYLNYYHKRAVARETTKDYKLCISAGYVSLCDTEVLNVHGDHVYFYPNVSVKINNLKLLKKVISQYYRGHSKVPVLSHHMSNLDCAINYCVNLGYKDIRLVGIDLLEEQYFFEQEASPIYEQASAIVEEMRAAYRHAHIPRKVHATNAPAIAKELGNLTISEYLPFLQKEILDQLDVTLYVTNKKSVLADKLTLGSII